MERSIVQQTTVSETVAKTTKKTWKDYLEVTKPGINTHNLLVTFAGFWLAAGLQTLHHFPLLLLTLLGTMLVIAGSCTLNNFYDRDIDPYMTRTKNRAVADGRIKPSTALWLGIWLSFAGFCVLAIGVNPLSALLAFIGFFTYVFIYTMWLKRKSTWSTVIGGISGAVPPLIGWTAYTHSIDFSALALFLILFTWQPPHFFALAMLKTEEYRKARVPMLPVVKGSLETKKQTLLFTLLLLPSSLVLFYTGVSSWVYLVVALLMGVIYIALSIKGFQVGNDKKWAKQMFLFSLLYLTVIFFVVIIDVAVMEWIYKS